VSDQHNIHVDLLELAQKIDLPKLIAETSLDSCGACGASLLVDLSSGRAWCSACRWTGVAVRRLP
jgi:hypothetical protein